jgi:hypothetical protein
VNRVATSACLHALAAALVILPPAARRLLGGTHVLAGVDPVFAGLHAYAEIVDGRSYRDTAHVCFGGLHCVGATTVVLPERVTPEVVVHEFGHVLHERLDWPVAPQAVTAYAEQDDWEAFAEAFTASVIPGYAPWPISLERLNAFLQRQPHLRPYFEEER